MNKNSNSNNLQSQFEEEEKVKQKAKQRKLLHQQQQEIRQKLQTLRVAKSELTSGNVRPVAYMQPSPGAAMFSMDRTVALERVDDAIASVIEEEEMVRWRRN